jgi:LysM repeat protein
MSYSFSYRNAGMLSLTAFTLLAGCSEPFDYDLRGNVGGFTTTDAARGATINRPDPDDRGIISYPHYQVAVAQGGDSVANVATRIGLPAEELARYNGVKTDDVMRQGEILALPRRVSEPSAATGVDIEALAGGAIDASADTTPVETTSLEPAAKTKVTPIPAAGPEPVRHKVVRGETAYTISRLYQVPVKSLGEWNGLGTDFSIREGQFLLIPIAVEPLSTATSPADPGVGSQTPTPPSAVTPLPDEKIDPKPVEVPEVSVGEPTQPSGTAEMSMPVRGKIISVYKKGKNEGINIAAAPGTKVTAAADGTVAAIINNEEDVPILVVRHSDNVMTVYANVTKVQVKKGDSIKRGQQLAILRGGDDAYVHFEVRNGFDSVDPMPYLE